MCRLKYGLCAPIIRPAAINYPLRHFASWLIIIFLLHVPDVLGTPVSDQSFSFPSFDNPRLPNVRFLTQHSWSYAGQDAAQGSHDSIALTPDPTDVLTLKAANIGKMVYKDPITFKSPQYGMASFNTSFTFKIPTTRDYPNCGSGMVFFIANYVEAPERSYGRYLGMVSPNYMARNAQRFFFAIEFDTHDSSPEILDVSSSHIGIDISSLQSSAVIDTSNTTKTLEYYPQLFLYNNYTFTVWVDYNATALQI